MTVATTTTQTGHQGRGGSNCKGEPSSPVEDRASKGPSLGRCRKCGWQGPAPWQQPQDSPAPEAVSVPGWEQTPRQPSPTPGQPVPRGDGTRVTCCPLRRGWGTGHISYISAGQKHVSAPIVRKPALEVLITT